MSQFKYLKFGSMCKLQVSNCPLVQPWGILGIQSRLAFIEAVHPPTFEITNLSLVHVPCVMLILLKF